MPRKRVPVDEALGSNAFFSNPSQSPSDQTTSTPVHQQTGRPASEEGADLVKATFYLDRESAELLDAYWLNQRKQAGLSKSELVRKAIRLLVKQ